MNQIIFLSLLMASLLEGHSLLAASNPIRIASLSLASDEILMDLIPSCGGVKRIIALSTLADDPSMSSITDKSGQIKGRVHSEPESLLSLRPDLVIGASFNRPELLRLVESQKIPLLTLTQFTSAEGIGANIEKIGEAIGCKPAAVKMRADFLRRVDPKTEVKKPMSIVLYDADMVAMGSETLFDDLVRRAGGVNAASKRGIKGWPKLDSEALLAMKPDALVVLEDDSPGFRAKIASHPAWRKLTAVQQKKFIFLKSRTAQSTSHYFADGVEELRRKLSH